MKIVYIARTGIPSRTANSVQIMKMCQAFSRNGHYLTLLVPDGTNFPAFEPNVDDIYVFYGVERTFRIKRLPWFPVKGQNIFFSLGAIQEAKKLKADLVYGRYLHGCLAAALLGIPVIFEAHTSMEELKRSDRWLLRRLFKCGNLRRVIVISTALKKRFLELYKIPEKKILVAHDGADLPQKAADKGKRSASRLQAGYIGQLRPGKGMEIICQLIPRCPQVDFHIVGGVEVDICRWKEKTKGFQNIFFHGFVPPGDLDRFRNSFDIFLAPYLTTITLRKETDIARWMSPLKIFEYMGAKKPIVASNLLVLREVLNDSNAVLVAPDDVDGWCRAIERLQNPELRKKLAGQAYEDFVSRYTWRARAQKVTEGV